MQSAFAAMVTDAEFRADAEKLQLAVNPASSDALATRVADVLNAPPGVIEAARRYYPK